MLEHNGTLEKLKLFTESLQKFLETSGQNLSNNSFLTKFSETFKKQSKEFIRENLCLYQPLSL